MGPDDMLAPPTTVLAAASRPERPPRRVERGPAPSIELDHERLAALATALAEAERSLGIDRTLALARALVDHVYGGDVRAWRSRSPKVLSLRKLAETGLLDVTPAALCRALAVYEVWSSAAAGRPWSRLSGSHYRAVQNLDTATQAELLEDAWRRGLAAEELRRRVGLRNGRRTFKGGRLPSHPIARLVVRLERELSAVDAVTLAEPGADLDAATAESLARRSESFAHRCFDLARELRRR